MPVEISESNPLLHLSGASSATERSPVSGIDFEMDGESPVFLVWTHGLVN